MTVVLPRLLTIRQLHPERTADPEEELVGGVVVMPMETPTASARAAQAPG
jgi:hypothetical protein